MGEGVKKWIEFLTAQDKCIHFIGGALVCFIAYMAFGVIAACVATIAAALGKELYDYIHPEKHTADPWDAIVTICGGASVFLILLVA